MQRIKRHQNKTGKKLVFELYAAVRRYTYMAYVSKATGKLIHIVAGCRDWKSFHEAFEHYRGHSRYTDKWSDANVRLHDQQGYGMAGTRADAVETLQRLERAVKRYAAKCHVKKVVRKAVKKAGATHGPGRSSIAAGTVGSHWSDAARSARSVCCLP